MSTTLTSGTGRLTARSLPRALHPVAWWIWALSLGMAASMTTNPLLLLLVLGVLGVVVTSRRSDAPWARGFGYYLALAGIVIVIRLVFRMIFTTASVQGNHVLLTLPTATAPSWYAGLHLGGAVTVEAMLAAVVDGLRLGTFLCCVGAANTLANPKRALRVLPGALYELGAAIVVALSIAPQLVDSMRRVRRARRLRAGRSRGVRAIRAIAVPVMEDALERSLRLAAAMDSRGYGRVGRVGVGSRRLTVALMLGGMVGLCLGLYGLLDGTTPRWLASAGLVSGATLAVAGLVWGGRRVRRSAYRPDPWRTPEWIVAGAGVAAMVVWLVVRAQDAAALNPSFSPLRWPTLPPVPAATILLAGLAGLAAPVPPRGGA